MGISRQNGNSPATEARLAAAAREGDRAAFEALYRLYHRGVWRHCFRMLGDGHLAEDVVQETFLRAWRWRETFDPSRPVWPWIFTIAQRACADVGRQHIEPPIHVDEDLPSDRSCEASLDLATLHDERHDLAIALSQLPDRYRRLLFLQAVEGWSYGQLAEADGSSVRAVAKVLARAKERVRVCLSGQAHNVRALILPAVLIVLRDVHARIKTRAREASVQLQMTAERGPLLERASAGALSIAVFTTVILGTSIVQSASGEVSRSPGIQVIANLDLGTAGRDARPSAPDEGAVDRDGRLLEEQVEVTDDIGTRAQSDTPKQGRVAPPGTHVRVDAYAPDGTHIWHEQHMQCNGVGSSLLAENGPISGAC